MPKRYATSVDTTVSYKRSRYDSGAASNYGGSSRGYRYSSNNGRYRGGAARATPALAAAVKDTVLKMAGLQTRQSVTVSTAVNTLGRSLVLIPEMMSAAQMRQHVITTPGSDERAQLRSCRTLFYIANATNVRLVVRAYMIECRKTNNFTIPTLLGDDAPIYDTPYIDPTTANSFRRYWRIVKRRFCTIPVEGYKAFKLSTFFPGGKLVTGDVEANSTAYTYTVGSQAWVLAIDTQPVEDQASALSAGPSIAKVNFFNHFMCTFYYIEDNDPRSESSSAMTAVAAGNVISDATRVPFQNDNA